LVLKKALRKEGLLKKYQSLAPSRRRLYDMWVFTAKRKETIDKRIRGVLKEVKKI